MTSLRAAAALIRATAAQVQARNGETWVHYPDINQPGYVGGHIAHSGEDPQWAGVADVIWPDAGPHIAAWSPDRALLVAGLLDALADDADSLAEHDGFDPHVTIPGYTQACALAELIGGA